MKVYNIKVDLEKLEKIIPLIKKKKELIYLDSNYILKEIKKYLLQNKKVAIIINEVDKLEKNADIKKLVKFVRDKAHDVYGMFQSASIRKREELLKGLKFNDIEKHVALLKTHISTKERININTELYTKIFSMTKKPSSILDLGCGLNPLTLPFMNLKKVEYIASDFNQLDMDFLTQYFGVLPATINGVAIKLDLLNDYDKVKNYNVDVCFLFKVLDSLEGIQKNISYEIIKNIKAKWIVVSFPMKTLSGKKVLKLQKRNWFEKICNRYEYSFETFEMGDEMFYIILCS